LVGFLAAVISSIGDVGVTYFRSIVSVLAVCFLSCVATTARGAGLPITAISSTAATGFDISLDSAFYNETFYAGNPSEWGNLQPGAYVEFTVNAATAGQYGVQAYYATPQTAGANLLVNGAQQSALNLASTGSWGTLEMSQPSQITLPSGQSVLRIAAQAAFQPYNLAGLMITPKPAAAATVAVTNVSATATTGFDITAVSASSGYTLYRGSPSLWGNLQPGGSLTYTIQVAKAGNYALQLDYSTTLSGGAQILVNSTPQQVASFPTTLSWNTFEMSSTVTLTLPSGTSTLTVAALSSFEPFNLEGMTLAPAAAAQSASYPLAGQQFYVNPYSEAAENVNASCSAYYPGSTGLIAKIAAQPQGVWFGDWNTNVQSDAANVVTLAAQQGKVPIMVAYDIPIRDCNGYSGGGATSAAAYQTWVQGLAAGIGKAKALLVLEPDALSQLYNASCLNSTEQAERLSLLNFAVTTLQQTAPNTAVYMDAGDAGANAIAVSDMAQRLTSAGVANAAGFSLNVSNYIATDETTAYGNQISALIGNEHFVIDTSRNGLGSDGDSNWCNPPGRGLGAPSQGFSSGSLDGYVWVQNPGTSDGTCNGGPPAGQFSVPIACTLAHNAIF
jgi:endoglucanase